MKEAGCMYITFSQPSVHPLNPNFFPIIFRLCSLHQVPRPLPLSNGRTNHRQTSTYLRKRGRLDKLSKRGSSTMDDFASDKKLNADDQQPTIIHIGSYLRRQREYQITHERRSGCSKLPHAATRGMI